MAGFCTGPYSCIRDPGLLTSKAVLVVRAGRRADTAIVLHGIELIENETRH